MKIVWYDTELQHTDSATNLGITFDKRDRPHIGRTKAKARRTLALLGKLAGT